MVGLSVAFGPAETLQRVALHNDLETNLPIEPTDRGPNYLTVTNVGPETSAAFVMSISSSMGNPNPLGLIRGIWVASATPAGGSAQALRSTRTSLTDRIQSRSFGMWSYLPVPSLAPGTSLRFDLGYALTAVPPPRLNPTTPGFMVLTSAAVGEQATHGFTAYINYPYDPAYRGHTSSATTVIRQPPATP